MFKIELGSKVADRTSGFAGTVVWRCEYLYGCRRYGVQAAKLTKDGKIPEAQSFDEDALRVTTAAKPHVVNDTGGPQRDPSPRTEPRR